MKVFSAIFLVFCLILSGCGGSKKKEALSGFYEGCYSSKTKMMEVWCKCAVDDLDKKMGEKFFEAEDQLRMMEIFQVEAKKSMDKCQPKASE